MYDGKIVEVFIASPSDVVNERIRVHEILDDWNIINTKKLKYILKSLRWEKNVYSSFKTQAQNIINEQALTDADIVIGIFKTRLGTPTEEYESGSVEEIKKHIENKKPTMVFFSKENVNPATFQQEQYNQLQAFKSWCQNNGITFDYNDIEDFSEIIRRQLGLIMNNDEYFKNTVNSNESIVYKKSLSGIQKDLIEFLKNLVMFQKEIRKMEEFVADIGDYRFQKILPYLIDLRILNAMKTNNGFHFITLINFGSYTEKDIENAIDDIQNS